MLNLTVNSQENLSLEWCYKIVKVDPYLNIRYDVKLGDGKKKNEKKKSSAKHTRVYSFLKILHSTFKCLSGSTGSYKDKILESVYYYKTNFLLNKEKETNLFYFIA